MERKVDNVEEMGPCCDDLYIASRHYLFWFLKIIVYRDYIYLSIAPLCINLNPAPYNKCTKPRRHAMHLLPPHTPSHPKLTHSHTKLVIATTPNATPALLPHDPTPLPRPPPFALALSSSALTAVRPVATMPFSRSAVCTLGPTFQKSTRRKFGVAPQSSAHCWPARPRAPVALVRGELTVVRLPTSGTWMPKPASVSLKWLTRPR